MTGPRNKTFAAGSTFAAAGLNATFHAWLTACGMMRNCSLSDAYASSSHGGVRRFGVLVNAVAPGVGGKFRVLDNSVDWRDRLLRVAFMSVDDVPSVALFPGANVEDKRFALSAGAGGAAHQLYWSGPGVALPQVAATGRSMRPTTTNGGLVVRSSDGALCWEKFSTDTHATQCIAVFVEGSERLGVSTSPPALAVPVGVDADAMTPPELNELQDAGVLSQFRGNAPIADVTPHPQVKTSEAFPLGPIVYGTPPVPVRALRRLLGEVNYDLSYEARQTVGATGILRRWVKTGAVGPSSFEVVDTSADWRDRMIVVTIRTSAADESPGTATTWAFSSVSAACYTGLGDAPATAGSPPRWRAFTSPGVAPDISIFARDTDGALVIRNEGINTYHILGFVEGSFPLGPRSARRPT
jgi:hypothetical protein